MYNPFCEIIDESESDNLLIADVLEGNMKAMEKLVYRHQAWIYNIALKMVCNPDDAEDVTQEILLKILTHLSAYDPARAAFRTWLYRIVANHVLNMRDKKSRTSVNQVSLADAFTMSLDNIEDKRSFSRPEYNLLAEETKNLCLTGMLLCLERKQRLAFILGEIFLVSSSAGSEILETTEVNFRALLSRARKKVGSFIALQCSLVNPENPCRCTGHVRRLIASGWIDPDNPRLSGSEFKRISSIATDKITSVENGLESVFRIFRDSPFYEGPDMAIRIKELMGRDEFREIFHLQ